MALGKIGIRVGVLFDDQYTFEDKKSYLPMAFSDIYSRMWAPQMNHPVFTSLNSGAYYLTTDPEGARIWAGATISKSWLQPDGSTTHYDYYRAQNYSTFPVVRLFDDPEGETGGGSTNPGGGGTDEGMLEAPNTGFSRLKLEK
ncbi:MAG: hypothetical protein KIG14_01945 [Candidatus Sacchiramonaceae bacterium]|nr:hypothetical protein [Candidatus Saccharimonadaceae bacterium]